MITVRNVVDNEAEREALNPSAKKLDTDFGIGGYDTVQRPAHYTQGAVECIDAIKSALTKEEYKGFLKGNVIKYIWRETFKNGKEDLSKAKWYLDRINQELIPSAVGE